MWDGKVRLSIAGYQDKLAVFEQDGQWFLVEDPRVASMNASFCGSRPPRRNREFPTSKCACCLHLYQYSLIDLPHLFIHSTRLDVLTMRRCEESLPRESEGQECLCPG